MAKIKWDQDGEKFYETGISHGVLYPKNATVSSSQTNPYAAGVAWNGLTSVSESPSGAEETPLYADDIKYLSLYSAEEFGGTIEAYTYPDEFLPCDGTIKLANVAIIGQQKRTPFGIAYKTKIGDDLGNEFYKLHIVYNATASVAEKQYQTVNDSPEAITFSWEFKTVAATATVNGVDYTTANIVIDSRDFSTEQAKAHLKDLEDLLFGTDETVDEESETIPGTDPTLPDIATVITYLTTGKPQG